MRTPDFLKNGDYIGIVSTARKVIEKEINPCEYIMGSWGLQVVKGNNLFQSDNQYSGADRERAQDMQQMLDDPEIKAILCARGGYGTIRIIDKLNFSKFKENPKWIIGFSDITVLHSHIHSNFNTETLHALMAINFIKDNKGVEGLRKALFGEDIGYQIAPSIHNRFGNCSGLIVGGNLSLIYSMTGTKSCIETKGKILFLEDLDEYLYHVDRMMINLKRAGILHGLSGLIVGGMSSMNDNEIPFGKNAKEIIIESVSEYDFPVCFDFPAGHLDTNMPLFLGREAKMAVDKDKATIQFLNEA